MSDDRTPPIIDLLTRSQLEAVRQRLGLDSGSDTSRDDFINTRTPLQLARLYAGWHLGDPYWADLIIDVYENAKKATEAQ